MKLSTSIWTVRNLLIVCASVLMIWMMKAYACGPDFTGYQYSLLLEQYGPKEKFFRYQYDPSSRFYSLTWDAYEEEKKELPEDTRYNVFAWREYLGLSEKVHDSLLLKFIYHNSSKEVRSLVQRKSGRDELEKSLLKKSNAQEVLQYLELMNEYKETIVRSQDAWDYATYTDSVSMDTVQPFMHRCELLMNKSHDDFLQWRAFYLLLRAAHFNRYYSLAITKFEEYHSKLPVRNSMEPYWCEGIYGGALLKTDQQEKAIYYTARAFAHCPDQHMQAMNTYLSSKRNWEAALKFCTNADDSVYVAMLEGANHPLPDIRFIQFVYRTNPNSEVLKLLWMREAMKIQDYLNAKPSEDGRRTIYIGYEEVDLDNTFSRQNILSDFISLSDDVLKNERNIPAKATVAHCMAFYFYKKGEYDKANDYLLKASNQLKTKEELLQHHLLQQLVSLKKDNRMDEKKFIELIHDFKSLPQGYTNRHMGYYLLYNEVAPWLLSKKDTVTAFWTYAYANCFDADSFDIYSQDYSPESFNASNFATYLLHQHFSLKDVKTLREKYLNQKGDSELETTLIKETKMKNGVQLFNLVIARKYMLIEDWEMALAALPELPKEYTERMGLNPANFYINDYVQDDSIQEKRNTYSVKRILSLAAKLKATSPYSARDKLLYGTLLYNLSYYGKNHYIVDNHWNHTQSNAPYYMEDNLNTHLFLNGEDIYDMPMNSLYQNYFHLQKAEQYLQEALPDLANEEEKAQCVFLLAKCWQKRCPLDGTDYVANSLLNPYFKQLTLQYKQTKEQERIFNTCSYYNMFLKRQ